MEQDPIHTGSLEILNELERFVVDNDELQELEESIGRFNIFDALGIASSEIRHSNFLAWLLDPAESHGLGSLFLKSLVMDLLRTAPLDKRPFSPIDLDGDELKGVEIRREWRNIDLLISCQEPHFSIAIENKIDSWEHSNQLQRYKQEILAEKPASAMFVYLTREGDEPSDADWVKFSYADIHRVFERTKTLYAKSIGEDVVLFLDHYLSLLRGRFMDDQEIEALCLKIYRKHRIAIKTILAHIGEGLVADVKEMLEQPVGHWKVFHSTDRNIQLVPASWLEWLPPLCKKPNADPQSWLVWILDLWESKCRIRVFVRECNDPVLRERAIERLTRDPKEFGCRRPKGTTETQTTLYSASIHEWPEGREPDKAELLKRITAHLAKLETQLAEIEKALKPIFEHG